MSRQRRPKAVKKPSSTDEKMTQLKVSLPDQLRSQLETAVEGTSRSLGDEIRKRIDAGLDREERLDDQTLRLAYAIDRLASYVFLQTGHHWHDHPAANRVMRHAITARLARLRPEGDQVFRPDELPKHRLVASGSDDPEAMGLGLEALEFHTPPDSKMTPEQRRRFDQLQAETEAEIKASLKKGEDNGKA
jgi:hypothetical protein